MSTPRAFSTWTTTSKRETFHAFHSISRGHQWRRKSFPSFLGLPDHNKTAPFNKISTSLIQSNPCVTWPDSLTSVSTTIKTSYGNRRNTMTQSWITQVSLRWQLRRKKKFIWSWWCTVSGQIFSSSGKTRLDCTKACKRWPRVATSNASITSWHTW